MSSRKVILLTLAVVCSATVFALVILKLKAWRQSRQISHEIAWIQDAVQQLQNSPAPAPELIQTATTGHWEIASPNTNRYLIFSNGWGVYRRHSSHANDEMDDITVLKIHNGGFYLSRYHFDFGIERDTLVRRPAPDVIHATGAIEMGWPDGSPSQPADAKDFFDNGARWQGWYLFSRDAKLQCIIRTPQEDRRREKKSVWVWIGTAEANGSKSRLKKTYSIFASRDMTWTANWTSDDEITVDVFDYGGNSPRMMGVDYPKRLLTTLIFERDKQSGMFLEKTNILRWVPASE
jgi:hypothetical protein